MIHNWISLCSLTSTPLLFPLCTYVSNHFRQCWAIPNITSIDCHILASWMSPTVKSRKCFFQSVFCKLPHSVCEQAERNKIVTLCTPWVHTACSDHCATLWGSSTKRFLNILNHQCSFCCEKRSQTMLSNTVIKHVARQFRNGKLCSCIFSFLQYLKIHFEKEW